ncbi:hypothetical protein HRbin36_01050 [bacterium HR36]|nr:hypothetical protein HRbin36_01050 [bacterium HR36]
MGCDLLGQRPIESNRGERAYRPGWDWRDACWESVQYTNPAGRRPFCHVLARCVLTRELQQRFGATRFVMQGVDLRRLKLDFSQTEGLA